MTADLTRILCVGNELDALGLRCAVLKSAGYETLSSTVTEAETLLCKQKFQLVILSSRMTEDEKSRILIAAGETPRLVLHGLTFPRDLLRAVQRLTTAPSIPVTA